MAHSSRAASRILAFAQAVNDQGLQAAATEFGVADLTGKPIEEAMSLLSEVFCEPGGGLDEGIASRAWSDTILKILDHGDVDIETIAAPQHWAFIIETFITESIFQRIINDIGNKALAVAQDVAAINEMARQVRDIIEGAVASAIPPLFAENNRQQDRVLQAEVQNIYELAFGFLEQLNEEQ